MLFGPSSYNAKAALCGYKASWRQGETLSLSLGYKLGGAIRPIQDLLGALRLLLESTLRHKVPIAGKNHCLSPPDQQKKQRDHLSPSFRENKCFAISLYLSDLALFGDSNELSTLLFYTVLRVGIQKLKVVLQSANEAEGPVATPSTFFANHRGLSTQGLFYKLFDFYAYYFEEISSGVDFNSVYESPR